MEPRDLPVGYLLLPYPYQATPRWAPRGGHRLFVFVPRFDRKRVLLAVAMLTPPVLLGALANMLMSLHLADLSLVPTGDGLSAVQAELRSDVELVNITFFVVFGLMTMGALHMSEDALRGLHGFGLATLLFVGYAVHQRWDLGVDDPVAAQIGLGIAFWGLGWVLIVLHLFSFLRTTPHRKWNWVTGGVGLYQAALFFLAMEIGILFDPATAALVFMAIGVIASVFFFANQDRVGRLWGYGRRDRVHLPDVDLKGGLFVIVYAVIVFGMIGAEYVHHFSYAPVWTRAHYLLLAATTPLGVVLFGALAERGGRRAVLYGLPISIMFALVIPQLFDSVWLLVVAEGIMLGSMPYLFQYLAEATRVLTRGTVFLFSMGAVMLLGLGGTFNANFERFSPIDDPTSRIFLQIASLLVAMVLAPQMPETQAQVTDEEDIEDYLALARQVGGDA